MTADQIPCTDRAQLAWLPPVGMAGGVAEYIPQYREETADQLMPCTP